MPIIGAYLYDLICLNAAAVPGAYKCSHKNQAHERNIITQKQADRSSPAPPPLGQEYKVLLHAAFWKSNNSEFTNQTPSLLNGSTQIHRGRPDIYGLEFRCLDCVVVLSRSSPIIIK